MIRRRAHMTPSVTLRRRPTPKTSQATRDRRAKKRAEDDYRQRVKALVWSQRPWCQLCSGSRRDECLTDDQMHEDPSRAKTRGKPMEERFNVRVCGRVCDACHRDITENRIEVVFDDPVQRFAGGLSVRPKRRRAA